MTGGPKRARDGGEGEDIHHEPAPVALLRLAVVTTLRRGETRPREAGARALAVAPNLPERRVVAAPERGTVLRCSWSPSPSTFTCDGRWHTGTFTIDTADFGPQAPDWGALERGQAWLQFCLLTTADENEFISDTRWIAVR